MYTSFFLSYFFLNYTSQISKKNLVEIATCLMQTSKSLYSAATTSPTIPPPLPHTRLGWGRNTILTGTHHLVLTTIHVKKMKDIERELR